MIEAVISDFGGVLTSPLLDSFAAFQDSSGISLEHLGLAMAAIWKRDGANPLFELETVRAVPADAQTGSWAMEWWWDQPGVPHVAEFNASIKKITGVAATARNWFGYASVQTLAVIANQEKTLDAPKLARALSGFKLPPEIALQPGAPEYRAGDHELMSTVFVGEAHPPQGDPDNMFTVKNPTPGEKAAGPADADRRGPRHPPADA